MKAVLALLLCAVAGSALAVVMSKHESRALFVQLRELEQHVDAMNLEWSQLQLEYGAWSTQSRVETLARDELNLVPLQVQEMERLP